MIGNRELLLFIRSLSQNYTFFQPINLKDLLNHTHTHTHSDLGFHCVQFLEKYRKLFGLDFSQHFIHEEMQQAKLLAQEFSETKEDEYDDDEEDDGTFDFGFKKRGTKEEEEEEEEDDQKDGEGGAKQNEDFEDVYNEQESMDNQ